MSSSPEATPTPENNDNDELVVKRVVRERGSSRPKEIVVEKRGVECVVTPRQVIKIDPEDLGDFDKPAPEATTRNVPAESEQPKEQKEQPKEQKEQPKEQAAATQPEEQGIMQKVTNWFKSFF